MEVKRSPASDGLLRAWWGVIGEEKHRWETETRPFLKPALLWWLPPPTTLLNPSVPEASRPSNLQPQAWQLAVPNPQHARVKRRSPILSLPPKLWTHAHAHGSIAPMLRFSLAAVHLIALGLGLGAVLARGTALREALAPGALRRAFRADMTWGIAFGLWLLTGLWRLFGETDKPVGYYMTNHVFFAKMGFLVIILALELWPMITLIRWRGALRGGATPEHTVDAGAARRIAIISHVQATLVVLMVFAAAAMARGFGARE